MKNLLTITWTISIIIILFFFYRYQINAKEKSEMTVPNRDSINKCTEVFSVHTFDSLIKSNEYVLLTLAFGDCSVCDVFRSNKIPDNFPIVRYYIDATYDKNNMLVLQSLYFTGFPLSYVIDQNYNIIGSIQGLACLRERLDSIIFGQYKLQPKTIPGIPRDKTYSVLSNSFKGLLSYMNNNHETMKKHAQESLSEGSFFFNNYLMYKYYEKNHCIDSIDYYRNRMLNNISSLEAFIYENLLTEIAPGKQIEPCRHKPDNNPMFIQRHNK